MNPNNYHDFWSAALFGIAASCHDKPISRHKASAASARVTGRNGSKYRSGGSNPA
jgi:hypothetical protein